MPVFEYASFPNSRNKNRAPTVQANTYQVAIAEIGQPLTLLSSADPNRTYIVLENFSLETEFFYLYATTTLVNPSAVATFGVPKQLIYNNVANILYQKQDLGLNTNWIVVAPESVGEKILPAQVATLESLEDIYALSNSLVPVPVVVGIDEGRG